MGNINTCICNEKDEIVINDCRTTNNKIKIVHHTHYNPNYHIKSVINENKNSFVDQKLPQSYQPNNDLKKYHDNFIQYKEERVSFKKMSEEIKEKNEKVEIEKIQDQLKNDNNVHIRMENLGNQSWDFLIDELSKKQLQSINLKLKNCQLNLPILSQAFKNSYNSLETLKLSFQECNVEQAQHIQFSLKALTNLTTLSINLNGNKNLKGDSLEELYFYLQELKKLNYLKLSFRNTKIYRSDLFAIQIFTQLKIQILKVDLSENKFRTNILDLIIKNIYLLSGLKELQLNLSYINLSGLQQSLWFDKLEQLEKLKLKLVYSYLDWEYLFGLFTSLSQKKNLKYLEVDFKSNCLRYSNQPNTNNRYLIDYLNPEKSFQKLEQFIIDLSFNYCSQIDNQNFYYLILLMRHLQKLTVLMNHTKYDDNSFEFHNLVPLLLNLNHLTIQAQNNKQFDLDQLNQNQILKATLYHIHSNNYVNLLTKFQNLQQIDLIFNKLHDQNQKQIQSQINQALIQLPYLTKAIITQNQNTHIQIISQNILRIIQQRKKLLYQLSAIKSKNLNQDILQFI